MSLSQSKSVQTFWVALGSLSSIAFSLISAMILSRYFSKEDYGTYKQIIYTYNTLLIVFSAGLPRVYAYFLPRFNNEEGLSIVNKVSILLFFFGILMSISLYLGANFIANLLNNMVLVDKLKLFALVPVFMLPTLGIEGIFSSQSKTIYIAIYNTLSRIIMLLFLILPVIYIDNNIDFAMYGWILSSI